MDEAAIAAAHEKRPHREPGQLTESERAEHALGEKAAGNIAFKAQEWATAVGRYREGLRYATYAQHHGMTVQEETRKIAPVLFSNCAAAYLKQDDAKMAVEACNQAIAIDPENMKAYFRRAQAQMALGNYDSAAEDALHMLEMDPLNPEAKQMHQKAERSAKEYRRADKAVCKNMLG
mmetsp:Transcript_15748/g.25114  ORF Transcript_15748/g.25114 Transcript_15748/m.25114 type:complete len:177 (+) Transcript_15748:40-570(+)